MVEVMGSFTALVSLPMVTVAGLQSSLSFRGANVGLGCCCGNRSSNPGIVAARVANYGSSSRAGRRSELGVRWRERGEVRALSSADEKSADNGQTTTEDVPSWAKPDSTDPPPWVKSERPASQSQPSLGDIPFPIYLIGSFLVATAAIGSIFEYFNQHAVFGVIPTDSPFYAPILGFFAFTGLPTSGFLFYKAIGLANKASEEADREDGVRR